MDREKQIKRAKISWYSRKECVDRYYQDRFVQPLGAIRDVVEKKIVLSNVKGKVLDGGCGPGRLALQIAGKGLEVIGVDASREMLNYADKEAEKKGLGNVKFENADIQYLPFADSSFDSVVSVHVLFHLPQWREILGEFVRVVKPGGRLIVELVSGDYEGFVARYNPLKYLRKLFGLSPRIAPEINPDQDYYARVYLKECKEVLAIAGAKFIRKYSFDLPNSIWFRNRFFGGEKLVSKLLAFKPFFWLVYFLELWVFRYLPTAFAPRYFVIAKKQK